TPSGNAAQRGSAPTIQFKNVELDLTSFFKDFAAPIIGQVQTITRPLAPALGVFDDPIPVISDLSGRIGGSTNVTLLDLMRNPLVGGFGGAALADFISEINDINSLNLPTEGDDFGRVSLGSFRLNDARAGTHNS